MLLTLVLSIRLAPLFCAKASSARITSLDLSLSGKYLPPRSSFVRTPYALMMFIGIKEGIKGAEHKAAVMHYRFHEFVLIG